MGAEGEDGETSTLAVARGVAWRTLPNAFTNPSLLLDPERPLPMSSLADKLFCDASNVTGIADRLESRGLVVRRSAEGDRRVKALTLTPVGAELRERVLEIMNEPPAAIASLTVADQRALRDILRRAVEQLRA